MPAKKLTPSEFLEKSGVNKIIENLQIYLKEHNKELIVSDVTDVKGHQYVDLVQEGGGVLGIALVGYTYVLEKMGIRFFSLAGTSAGSINAMLIASAGNKEDEKSSSIVEHLVNLEMFSFVDGKSSNWNFTKFIKKKIQKLLLGSNVIKKIMRVFIWTISILLLLAIGSFVLNFLKAGIAKWLGVAATVALLILVFLILFARKKFKQFSKSGYGLNEGKVFHNWIKNIISSYHIQADPKQATINNYSDFSKHYMRLPPDLKVKPDSRRTNNTAPNMPMLTLITCDIVSERKIEFTQMWDLYWSKTEDAHPGDFVRASMSIPVFFETYCIEGIRKKSSFEIWDKHLNWQNEKKSIPDKAQFIDGGTLSNFPINVFYNPNYPVPRMPTFGIRLQDGITDSANTDNKTLGAYISSLFATIRFNYDRDFITKNRAYNMGVKNIDVQDHSWLNFFMEDDEKVELFKKGATAAAAFLQQFDWEGYKTERLKNFQIHEDKFDNPNNMEVSPYKV